MLLVKNIVLTKINKIYVDRKIYLYIKKVKIILFNHEL